MANASEGSSGNVWWLHGCNARYMCLHGFVLTLFNLISSLLPINKSVFLFKISFTHKKHQQYDFIPTISSKFCSLSSILCLCLKYFYINFVLYQFHQIDRTWSIVWQVDLYLPTCKLMCLCDFVHLSHILSTRQSTVSSWVFHHEVIPFTVQLCSKTSKYEFRTACCFCIRDGGTCWNPGRGQEETAPYVLYRINDSGGNFLLESY
jgi:hypothetical protein